MGSHQSSCVYDDPLVALLFRKTTTLKGLHFLIFFLNNYNFNKTRVHLRFIVEPEQLTLSENQGSPPVYSGARTAYPTGKPGLVALLFRKTTTLKGLHFLIFFLNNTDFM
jgi:hypothetical protein